MRIISERIQRLWEEWDIRVMVLVSLIVQIILIFLGACRKYTRQTWIQIVVWSMYMIADSVAMFCLGKLSDVANNVDSCTPASTTNNDIVQFKALWAPLLLLHLGGPDTITAYSVEDIRLYLRHVLGLVLNVGLALYVFLRFWTGDLHWIASLAFPLFVAGIAKYGERSWVLWRADNVFPRPRLPIQFCEAKNILDDLGQDGEDVGLEVKMLALSYIWLQALDPCLTGSNSIDYGVTPSEITSMIWNDGESAFKIFEIQLGFLYDMLYTKANNIYTKSGCILRLVSFICVVTALVGFSTFGSHDYSDADVCITYVLLVGAVVLEVYALALMIWSEWVLIWTSKHCKNPFWKYILLFLARKLCRCGKRWANSLPTLSLFSVSLYNEKPAILYWISKRFSLYEKLKAFTCRRNVDKFENVKELIREEVKRQLEAFSRWDYLHLYPTERGKNALRRHHHRNRLDDRIWCIDGRSFDISIVIWHLATSYCYYERDEEQPPTSREGAKLMSDYMMYLLVSRPHMLGVNVEPCDLSAIIGCYAQMIEGIVTRHGSSRDNDFYSKQICREIVTYEPQVCTNKYGINSNMGSLDYGRIPIDARELAAKLTRPEYEDRKWEMMSQVWAEMLCHAAAKCKYETHLRELMRGGEFISQVWLFLLIHGLIEESPTNFLRSLFKSAVSAGTDDATASRPDESTDASEQEFVVGIHAVAIPISGLAGGLD
ncbi:hypothetical protein LguiB_005333 [Lonicera macranthoides]